MLFVRKFALDGFMLLVVLFLGWVFSWTITQHPRITAYPPDTFPVMLPRTGFFPVERLPDSDHPYRWTGGESRMDLANPGGHLVVQVELGGGPERTIPVVIQSCGHEVSFLVTPSLRNYKFLLPPAPSERIPLHLTAPTFLEAGDDLKDPARDLALMVGDVMVSGGGKMPDHLVMLLGMATIIGYLLLRCCDEQSARPLLWGSMILILQVTLLGWYTLGGWVYSLLSSALWLMSGASIGAIILAAVIKRIPQKNPGTLQATGDKLVKPVYLHTRWLLLLVLLLMLAIRIPFLTAPDPVGDLELAARRMWHLKNEGLAGAYLFEGDYMPLRIYLLSLLSRGVLLAGETSFHEPLPPIVLVLIKLPSLLADLITISIIYFWCLRWQKPGQAAFLAMLYGLAPPVWINVAWWGQVDALLMLPMIGALVLLERKHGVWSWLCWAIALLIKPQALIIAPLLYGATLRLHGVRGFALGTGVASGVFMLLSIPLILAHQGPGIMQAYLGSVGRFPKLTIGAYNLWYLLTAGEGGDDTIRLAGIIRYRHIGLLLVAGIGGLVMLAMGIRADSEARMGGGAILALAFFLLPTQIHERYLFLCLAFMMLWVATRPDANPGRLLLFLILVTTATINILGTLSKFIPVAYAGIEALPWLPVCCAILNLIILGILVYGVVRSIFSSILVSRFPAIDFASGP